MPTYTYKARDTAGALVKGAMDAVSKAELIDKLHKMGYMATSVNEALAGLDIESKLDIFQRLRPEDMIMFYIQFSNMLGSGISIISGLNVLSKQTENNRLRGIVGDILRDIEAGNSLSGALSRHPRVFSSIFISMVKAGEASGKLDTILARYAAYSEYQLELRQKIKAAFFYPVILLCAAIAVILFIVTFIIPQFAEIFLKIGIKLPVPTMILYSAGIIIKQFWLFIVISFIATAVGLAYYAKTRAGKLVFDRLKLKLPLFGQLYRKTAISRFARTLGLLAESGVGILESLDITKEVIANEVLGRVINDARSSVESGNRISEPLKISGEFAPDAVQMIATGEETGNLSRMLDKVADIYDISINYTIKKLTTVIEPLFLSIMGCVIGFIMASLLLPMFDMIKILRH